MTPQNSKYIHHSQPCQSDTTLVASLANKKIRRIRRLHYRKDRDETGLLFVEGMHVLREAAEHAQIETLIIAPALLKTASRRLASSLRDAGVFCLEVTPEVFQSLAVKHGNQGIGGVVRQKWRTLEDIHLTEDDCWIALAGVQYPGNLGTIIRTSDAVGGAGVILVGPSTDPYDPACVLASMGAVFSQQVARASLQQFADWKTRQKVAVIGTSPAAALEYRQFVYPRPFILLMGCERGGLSQELLALCDRTISIPMVGRCDSLNLAVATGVVLYERFNQHRRLQESRKEQRSDA